jgi:acetyl esterase/lipase
MQLLLRSRRIPVLLVCAFLCGLSPAALAKAEKTNGDNHTPRLLWPKGAPGAKGKKDSDIPAVIVYLPPATKATGAAIVICPGGGYGGLAMDHEGHQVARWLNSLGVAGVIVRYRVVPYRHPYPSLDAQRAVRYTRAHAKQWHIDPSRVGILGFSAGGHLASTVGTHFDRGKKDAPDPIDRQSCRPDFMVLVYPVISLTASYTHSGSRDNLLGPDAAVSLRKNLSNELQITDKTPPAFLVHTTEDTVVPPENSIAFYLALHKAKVPAEIHIFEKGQHGLGLGRKGFAFSHWPELCVKWLRVRKALGKK